MTLPSPEEIESAISGLKLIISWETYWENEEEHKGTLKTALSILSALKSGELVAICSCKPEYGHLPKISDLGLCDYCQLPRIKCKGVKK